MTAPPSGWARGLQQRVIIGLVVVIGGASSLEFGMLGRFLMLFKPSQKACGNQACRFGQVLSPIDSVSATSEFPSQCPPPRVAGKVAQNPSTDFRLQSVRLEGSPLCPFMTHRGLSDTGKGGQNVPCLPYQPGTISASTELLVGVAAWTRAQPGPTWPNRG